MAKFVVDYKYVANEKQNTGDFWKAFMRCYGVEDTYLHGVTFEYQAKRSDTGGLGYIDVFFPGEYLIEQKSHGKISRPRSGEPSNAKQQAAAYLTGGTITEHQMPRWVITSDFATIQVRSGGDHRRSASTRSRLQADLALSDLLPGVDLRTIDEVPVDPRQDADLRSMRRLPRIWWRGSTSGSSWVPGS